MRTVGYGIDIDEYPILPLPFQYTCGFIGNYRHTPNSDAVLYFVRNIWEKVLEKKPSARMLFAGPEMPQAIISEIEALPGIEYLGKVEALQDFYCKIDVFVNPIVSQRGLRTKVVEVAAFGRPIVSTTLGAEGLEDLEIRKADSPEMFAHEILVVLDSLADMASEIKKNHRVVEEKYSVGNLANRLIEQGADERHAVII